MMTQIVVIQTARRKCRSKSRTAPVASAGTADSFPGDRATLNLVQSSPVIVRSRPARRRRSIGRAGSPTRGEHHLQEDTAGRSSQPDEWDRVLLQVYRIPCNL